MGKSTASCFKIMACGGTDSLDHGDLQTPQLQSKVSSARSGWSFRKQSARHRVLSTTIVSEAPSCTGKENPESTVANLEVQANLAVPEKDMVYAQVDSNPSDTIATKEDDCGANASPNESSAILIQAAVRGHLARRVLWKQKKIVKLQAAVRGHLVRRHAVGTLRCVQAIVKVQALVRERRARLLVEGSGDFAKQKQISKDSHNPPVLRSKREAKENGTHTYISTENLLSNKFARQLMESTPKTKSINIKCDPIKSDAAWKWLERWMSVSSVRNAELHEKGGLKKSGSASEHHEKGNLGYSNGERDILVPSIIHCELKDSKSAATSAETSENDESLITCAAVNLDIHASPNRPVMSHPIQQNIEESDSRYDMTKSGAVEMMETNLIQKMDAMPVLSKEEAGNQQVLPDPEKFSFEQPETERKRYSRKASNPSFIAAHSKFEELSSAAATEKTTGLSTDYSEAEFTFDKVFASAGSPFKSGEIGWSDASISNPVAVQITGSECGTELSISSTLDSPDMSDGGVYDLELEPNILDATDHYSKEKLGCATFDDSSILGTELSYANIDHLGSNETVELAAGDCVTCVITSDSPPLDLEPEKKPESDQSSMQQLEPGSDVIHVVDNSSPASHMTRPESQATTPSSQVSLNSKNNRGGKMDSYSRKKLLIANKSVVSTPNHENNLKQPEEPKTGKRRKSFGSTKLDHNDQEPRGGSGRNSVPSYMLPTESARAKALSSGSPMSSPDVQDKDILIKNRPQQPGRNDKQESPRIQAQQNAKGNGTHSPQDRKWRR